MKKVTEYMKASKQGKVGYKKFKRDMGDGVIIEQELAYLPPTDNMLDMITYDPEILELAVMERRHSGKLQYPTPDELAMINNDYQFQCRIYEHLMDVGLDYYKVPSDHRAE